MKYLVFAFFIMFDDLLYSQDTLMPIIFLDDVVISEENNGFSVEDFVSYVRQDSSFYMGFKYLRYYSHKYDSKLTIFNKQGDRVGVLQKQGDYYSNGNKAWLVDSVIYNEGKIFKRNGAYKYYTPKAFDEVFFPKDTFFVSLTISKNKDKSESKNMRDAKKIGFFIGTDDVEQFKVGLSKRLAIFDPEMQQYYNYSISEVTYNNIDCYVFSIKVKEDLSEKDKKKTLIRNIVSYFDKKNFNVIYRDYKFVFKNWFIDVDMDIQVRMNYVNKKHVPSNIYYKGYWNVLFLKPERVEFFLNNTSFQVN